MDKLGKVEAASAAGQADAYVSDAIVPVDSNPAAPAPAPKADAVAPIKLAAHKIDAHRKVAKADEEARDRQAETRQEAQPAPATQEAPPPEEDEGKGEKEAKEGDDGTSSGGNGLLIAGGILGLGLIGAAVASGGGGGGDKDSEPDNRAPSAQADTASATEGGTVVTGTVAANDSDPDGDSLTYTLSAPVAGLTLQSNGSYSFDPSVAAYDDLAAGEVRTVVATYSVSDGEGGSDTATLTITVTGVNDAPVAVGESYATNEDTALVVPAAGVLANDSDVDGDALSAVLVTGPAHGTLTLNADGSFTYTPNADYNGADSFTYKANDGSADSAPVTVNLTVNAVNDAPVAAGDTFTTNEDTALVVPVAGVLANDSDPENDPLTAVLVSGPTHGTLTLNADGSFTYTPDANYNGADSFTYKANDGAADSAPVTVTLNVNPVNDAPVANAESYATNEDTALVVPATGVLANDSDIDGDPLTAVLVSGPAHGTLSLNADGSFTYTPNADYNGPDSFSYKANDVGADSAPVTVNLTVNPVNDAPVALAESYTTDEDVALIVPATGVLANDSDVEGDPLTAILVTGPAHGTLTLNADGSFTYTPNADYNGPDSFTYQANDGSADSAPVTVTLTVNAVNDAPVAAADAFVTDEDTPLTIAAPGLLGNDSDVDGDPLTASLVSGPSNGTLVLNADGSFTYTPNADFAGSDSFTYTANDGIAASTPVTVSLTVNPANDAPVAQFDNFIVGEDGTLNVGPAVIFANDFDADGDSLSAVLVDGPQHGTLTLNADGSFIYTPNANYVGPDSFSYSASDGTASSAPAPVNIFVVGSNDAPVAAGETYATSEDTALVVPATGVLANDSDVDGDVLSAVLVTGPAHGTLTLNADGSFTYTPNANFNGADSFTYKANDGTLDSAPVTVNLSVTAVNDAPVVAGDGTEIAAPIDEDSPNAGQTIQVLFAGQYSDSADNQLPSGGASSPGAFSGIAVTGNGSSAATGQWQYYDGAAWVDIGAVSDSSAKLLGNPFSTLIRFTPAPDFNGPAPTLTVHLIDNSLPFGITNGQVVDLSGPGATGGTTAYSSGTVVLSQNVTPINDTPAVSPDNYSTAEDTTLSVPAANGVLANDTDAEGTPLTAVLVDAPTHGTLTLNADGSFSYTPAANYNGPDSFTYKATDGGADSAPVTVNLTVTPVNDAPVATGDSFTLDEDTVLTVTAPGVLSNDTDADGDSIVSLFGAGPAHGTVSMLTDGSFTYTPDANYSGSDSFTYQVADGTGPANFATVNLTVNAVNDAGVANDDSGFVLEGDVLNVPAAGVLANDTDPDSPLSVVEVNGSALDVGSQITLASGALLTLNADGSYDYDPNGQFDYLLDGQQATDSFSYTINDGTSSDTADVTITIEGDNIAPVATDDAFTMTGNTPITLTRAQLLGNDYDPDGSGNPSDLTSINFSNVNNGTISDNGDGTYTFVPTTGFEGATTFDYTVTDADGAYDTATVTMNVAGQVWYVDATYAGAYGTSDGSYLRPYTSLAPLSNDGVDVDGAGDTIFVYNRGTYTSGIVLENGQVLVGDGQALNVNGIDIGANTSNTTINHAGVGVTLASGNIVLGLTLNGTANGAIGVDDGGNNVGTFVMDSSSIIGLGKAVDIDQGGTLAVDLDVLSSASSTTEGVHLQGVGGSFNASTGIIQTSTGTGVLIGAEDGATAGSGGNVAFTYGGDIVNPGGSLVNIQDRTGGSVTFSGSLTEGSIGAGQTGILVDGSAGTVNFNGQTFVSAGGGAGHGVALTNNSGTINFAATGTGLDITTASGVGLTFTGGGTLNITGSANSITTTGGQIMNLANGTMGTNGIAFQTLTSGTVTQFYGINISNLDAAGAGVFNGGAVTIGGAAGFNADGINIYGSNSTFNFTSATIDNTNGDGIEIGGIAGNTTGSVTFGTVNIDGTAGTGISIIGATNAVNVNGGSIGSTNDPAGDAVNITGGTGAVTIAASITKTTAGGDVVDISGHSGGLVNFTGAISASGGAGGINLTNNSSGNINFSGDVTLNTGALDAIKFTNTGASGASVAFTEGSLDIDTTSGTGINATNTTVGAGLLTITGSQNTVSSTTGRAINVDGVTSNLTLNEVNVSGNGTTTGIFLKNTGAGGQFVVTGDGSTAGSGGIIKDIGGANLVNATAAASSGTAIYLENVSNVSLSNMTFGSTAVGENLMSNFGIRGTNVNNFTLRDSVFLGSFGDTYANGVNNLYEGTIRFGSQGGDGTGNGLTGTALFEGNTIGGGYNDNFSIFNNNTGTLNMTVRDSINDQAVFNHNGVNGNDNILIETRGNGGAMGAGFNLTLLVDGVEFKGARGDIIQTVAASNTDQTITIQNSSFINSHPNIVSGGGGATLSGGGNTSAYNVDYAVINNVFKGAEGTAIGVNYSGLNVNASGVITNNVIGTPNGTFDSSQALGGSTNGGSGISVTSEKYLGAGSVAHAVRIENNTVADINNGIAGISLAGGNQGNGSVRIEATVTNNTVIESGPDLFTGFYSVVGGAALSGDTTQMGLNLSGNAVKAGSGSGENAYYFDQLSTDAHYYFPGYVGSANGEWAVTPGTASTSLSSYIDNTKFNDGINGAFPSFGGIVNAGMVSGVTGSAFVLPTPLLASATSNSGWENDAASGFTVTESAAPSAAELSVLIEAAISRWADAGATSAQLATMRGVDVDFADLTGLRLGESTEGHILIDANAAGHGWFVDATPGEDSEFAASGAGIGDQYDLLSVLTHELGHQIGLDDRFDASGGVMEGIAQAGVRTMPESIGSHGSAHSMGWADAAELLEAGGGSVSSLLSALKLDGAPVGGHRAGADVFDFAPTFEPLHHADPSHAFTVVADERVL